MTNLNFLDFTLLPIHTVAGNGLLLLDDMDDDHGWTREDRSDLKRLSVIMASCFPD